MPILSLLGRASRAFEAAPASSKLLLFCTLSGGSFVAYSESNAEADKKEHQKKKKVVVLGTGWAGISFLKDLDISSYDVQVVSPQNYFAFTPLLPSVTCGTVEARSIVEPVRNIVKKVLRYLVEDMRTWCVTETCAYDDALLFDAFHC